MSYNYCFILLAIHFAVGEAFFLLEDKEPFFFCFKICPLYCSPRRRRDEDASSLIYTDNLPPFIYAHDDESGVLPYYFCKPPRPDTTTTSTTTQKTTTAEPTFICQLCFKKCVKKFS